MNKDTKEFNKFLLPKARTLQKKHQVQMLSFNQDRREAIRAIPKQFAKRKFMLAPELSDKEVRVDLRSTLELSDRLGFG